MTSPTEALQVGPVKGLAAGLHADDVVNLLCRHPMTGLADGLLVLHLSSERFPLGSGIHPGVLARRPGLLGPLLILLHMLHAVALSTADDLGAGWPVAYLLGGVWHYRHQLRAFEGNTVPGWWQG